MTAWARDQRVLTRLLVVAVVVSIPHFADNTFNYDAYPESDAVPAPPAGVVFVLWFFFTATALLGYRLFAREGPSNRALLTLAVYTASGIGGFGHYATTDAFHMPWWRQAAVTADIACGLLILAFVLDLLRRRGDGVVR